MLQRSALRLLELARDLFFRVLLLQLGRDSFLLLRLARVCFWLLSYSWLAINFFCFV